jgi:hypothetical protein
MPTPLIIACPLVSAGSSASIARPGAFDRLGDGLLVNRIDDAHNDLRHTLRENVLVEFARSLRD